MQTQSESNEELAKYCETQSQDENNKENTVWKVLAQRLRGQNERETLVEELGMEEWKEKEEEKKEEEKIEETTKNDADIFDAIGKKEDKDEEVKEKEETSSLWGESDWEGRAGRLACSGNIRGAWNICGEAGEWTTALTIARELGNEEEVFLLFLLFVLFLFLVLSVMKNTT